MNKSLLKTLLIFALSGVLFSCSDSSAAGSVSMTATVTSLGERLEVEVIESEYTFGTHLVITDTARVFNKNGDAISVSDIKVGDSVKIEYSGQVMLSYPPQIVAKRITVL